MEDAALPGWVLPVTLVLGAIVLAFIRVWFGIDEKKNRSECWSDRLLEEAHLRAGLVFLCCSASSRLHDCALNHIPSRQL